MSDEEAGGTLEQQDTAEVLTFATFLEETPPGISEDVCDLVGPVRTPAGGAPINQPLLSLFCPYCRGNRNFACTNVSQQYLLKTTPRDTFLLFLCRDCQRNLRTYALNASWTGTSAAGVVFKYGGT